MQVDIYILSLLQNSHNLKRASDPVMCCAVPSNDGDGSDEFEKWQREIREAEAETERLKTGSVSRNTGDAFGFDDQDRPLTPPEGEEEFTDDDGTRYKWDRNLRAWVPQVGAQSFLSS